MKHNGLHSIYAIGIAATLSLPYLGCKKQEETGRPKAAQTKKVEAETDNFDQSLENMIGSKETDYTEGLVFDEFRTGVFFPLTDVYFSNCIGYTFSASIANDRGKVFDCTYTVLDGKMDQFVATFDNCGGRSRISAIHSYDLKGKATLEKIEFFSAEKSKDPSLLISMNIFAGKNCYSVTCEPEAAKVISQEVETLYHQFLKDFELFPGILGPTKEKAIEGLKEAFGKSD